MKPDQSKLLIDSDAFCKLAAANLLNELLGLLKIDKTQCARLPSLLPMLRRGRLRQKLGDAVADALHPIAAQIAMMDEPSGKWLDLLVEHPAIDVGEAQIYALAAEHGLRVLTGDKRSLVELSKLPIFRDRLGGCVVSLEAVLLGLSGTMSEVELRARGSILAKYDSMARAIFRSAGSPLAEGAESYLRDLERSTDPMRLWRPGD